MTYHHDQHYQNDVNTLNALVEGTPAETSSLQNLIHPQGKLRAILRKHDPYDQIRTAAVGVYHHELFFQGLAAPGIGGGPAIGHLSTAINESFGNFTAFQSAMTAAILSSSASKKGPGWVSLVAIENPRRGGVRLAIVVLGPNQPVPKNMAPLLMFDVWEHAYYIDRRNDAAAYVAAFWQLVNWDFANANLAAVQ